MSEILQGILLKGIGGFYYVDTKDGVYECRARGLFRKQNIKPLVGDRVVINSVDKNSKTAFIDEILERDNVLLRPAVANVSQLIAVISAENPKPNLYLLDKVIASCEAAGIDILVCVNKTDLSGEKAEFYADIYRKSGFKTVEVSAVSKYGADELRKQLKDKISVFAGNSGVGKSSIINLMLGEDFFETGEVSRKAERGRHTTRHSELKILPFGGYIIDTPGFGALELENFNQIPAEIMFREFRNYFENCRFTDCKHECEEGCAVISAVENGQIEKSRYESYMQLCASYDNYKNNGK